LPYGLLLKKYTNRVFRRMFGLARGGGEEEEENCINRSLIVCTLHNKY
jgi:putative NADPH-quinone reductase